MVNVNSARCVVKCLGIDGALSFTQKYTFVLRKRIDVQFVTLVSVDNIILFYIHVFTNLLIPGLTDVPSAMQASSKTLHVECT